MRYNHSIEDRINGYKRRSISQIQYALATPAKAALTIFIISHAKSMILYDCIQRDYIAEKALQFAEHPLVTAIEVASPYLIPYTLISIARMKC
jgi:hypothetical protein